MENVIFPICYHARQTLDDIRCKVANEIFSPAIQFVLIARADFSWMWLFAEGSVSLSLFYIFNGALVISFAFFDDFSRELWRNECA